MSAPVHRLAMASAFLVSWAVSPAFALSTYSATLLPDLPTYSIAGGTATIDGASADGRHLVGGFLRDGVPNRYASQAFLVRGGQLEMIGTASGDRSIVGLPNQAGVSVGTSTSYRAELFQLSPAQTPVTVYRATGSKAFTYDHGQLTDLGSLGGDYTEAAKINDKGVVIGTSTLAGSRQPQAYVYQDGQMTGLGTLGGKASFVYGINNDGLIVGTADNAQNQREPCIGLVKCRGNENQHQG